MNLVLLENHEFLTESEAQVGGRKALHIREVLKSKEGQSIKVGRLGDRMGRAVVAAMGDQIRLVDIKLDQEPPAKLPVKLIVALPRPKVFKRLIEIITSLGVSELVFVNATKVDKAYWHSTLMDREVIDHHVKLGLEQSVDTMPMGVSFERLLKPFVEDRLLAWAGESEKWIAHPNSQDSAKNLSSNKSVIAIGPEGGWNDYEIKKFEEVGFKTFGVGPRILRVESAVQVAIAPFLI